MEEWRDIPGYEGLYKVSDLGRVLSVRRDRMLKPGINKSGYYTIALCKDSTQKTNYIHQLVAESFIGHSRCGYGYVVDHINGDKLDNKSTNLQILSNRENISKGNRDKNKTSKYTGVSYNKNYKKWVSQIKVNKKVVTIGRFVDEIEASKAYQDALKKYNLI